MGDIRKMFDPKTVALFGATDEEGTVGRTILGNLLLYGKHKTFPVNPNRDKVLDLPCYPDLAAIKEKVELAVVATPASSTPDIVEACGKAGVEGIVIISDFKEVGELGTKIEEEIKEIRKAYGMRILGPNSVGIMRPGIINTSILETQPAKGNIAFISQSASLGSVVVDWATAARIGFSMFVSPGSMIDINFGDLIDFLGEDPATRSIMMFMESIGNARTFMSAARGFARNKPIIVVKPGQFRESGKGSVSRTGSMVAGDDLAYDVAFKRAGVVRVREISDLFNAGEVLHSKHLPRGPRLAIVTNAGGAGIVAADALIQLGGKLAALTRESIDELNRFLPAYWSRSNPIDVLRSADVERYVRTIDICLKDPGVDGVAVIYVPQNTAGPVELAEAVARIAGDAYKPIITTWMGTKSVLAARDVLTQNNIPNYQTPEEAIKTYLYMYRYGRNLELLYETPAELPVNQAPAKNHLKAFIRRTLKEERRILTEEESKNFLVNYGIRCTTPFFTSGVESAVSWANHSGYPVVLKVVSPNIIHRSDVGGMATGIYTEKRLRSEYGALLARVQGHLPEADVAGVTIEKMIENVDYELILGAKKDKEFGSIILFGRGGRGAEVERDFSVGLPPLNQTLARLVMEKTGVYRMLKGVRGKEPVDLRELEQVIVSFSNLIVDFPEIAEMDINPIAVSGGKAYAVNARIVLENPVAGAGQYPHLVITPYPSRYISYWPLSDGTQVLLRPVRPEDEPLEHELLTSLSPATMRSRFFSIIKDISHEMLVRFCNIDYDREIAIVAEVKDREKRRMVGIARLIIDREFRSGEYAVLVHDEYQGKGLGYKLVDVLIGIAEDKGLEQIYGEVLAENEKMLAVCRRLGFRSQWAPDDDVTRVTLQLK